MSQTVSAVIVMTPTGGSSYVATVRTRTTEAAAAEPAGTSTAQMARNPVMWKARDIQRLGQLPLDSDDPAPARVEACITHLNNRVRDLPGDEDFPVTEEEDAVLKDIQRCEGQG